MKLQVSQIIISLQLLWRDLSKLTNGVVNWEEFFREPLVSHSLFFSLLV